MSLDQDLVKLVREVVKAELNNSRMNATEIVGRGGDTVLSSMGNIFIQPGTNKKAYYHETEIGSGSGTGGTTVKVSANDTTAGYLNGKLVAGANISLTEGSDGGNETLTVALTGGGAGDVYLANDNIFTGDHQTIRGAGGSEANSPTLLFRNSTWSAVDYRVLQLTDEGYLDIGQGDTALPRIQGSLRCTGKVYPTVTDSHDIGESSLTLWWRNVYAQKYYIDNASTYISLVGSDMKFFDANNAAGKTLTELVAGGVHSSLSNLDYASAGHTGFFPLVAGSGNTLTGDLYIDKATPGIVLKNSTVIKGYVQATSTEFDVYPSGVPMSLGDLGQVLYGRGSSIIFKTAVGDVTRLTIADAAITAAVPLAMGSNAITTSSTVDGVDVSAIPSTYLALAGGAMTGDVSFTDGTGIDLRNDNVHKIAYVSGTNSMDISSYTIINMNTTVDSNTPLSIASDGVRLGEALFFRKSQASDTVYIIDDATANMEFHVGTGKVFEFIVD